MTLTFLPWVGILLGLVGQGLAAAFQLGVRRRAQNSGPQKPPLLAGKLPPLVPRFPLSGRFRRSRAEPSADANLAPRLVRRARSPGALRRERREIMRAREELIRDLGGLALEMYRRDQFRDDLLAEHARDVVSLESRLHELDSMLASATAAKGVAASRCACGAPILWGSHFCANCGRPAGEAAVVSCGSCGHPLPADAEFCPGCGKQAELQAELQSDEAVKEVVEEAYERAAEDGEADATVIGSAREPADRWEH